MEKHVAVASGSDKEPPDLPDHVSRLPSRLGPGMGISHGINAYIERSGMEKSRRNHGQGVVDHKHRISITQPAPQGIVAIAADLHLEPARAFGRRPGQLNVTPGKGIPIAGPGKPGRTRQDYCTPAPTEVA